MLLKALEYKIFKNSRAPVIFSINTCSIFQPDQVSLTILDCLSGKEPMPRDRVLEDLQGRFSETEVLETLDELEHAGLVSSFEHKFEHEPAVSGHRPPVAQLPLPGVSHLVMNVSHACNLKCTYCYADGGSYKGRTELMSTDMAASLAGFLLDNTSDQNVMITFFGGEPLLNTEAIQAAVLKGREEARRAGKRIGFAITTNGTLHDEKFLSFAMTHDVRFTISIDGLQEAHDRHRKFTDGCGSYAELMARLPGMIKNAKPPARTTLTRDNLDVVEIIDHLLPLGFSEVGFAPVDATDGDLSLREAEMEQLLEGFETLAERFLKNAADGRMYGFSNIINLMKLFHDGDVKPLPCGAGLKLMGASPDGELFLCHRFTGNSDFRIGSVHEGFDDKRRREILGSALLDSKPVCRSCWARHLCGGGCHYLSHLHFGNIIEPHSLTCDFLRRWYEIGMKVYSHIALENPDFLEKCTGMRLNC